MKGSIDKQFGNHRTVAGLKINPGLSAIVFRSAAYVPPRFKTSHLSLNRIKAIQGHLRLFKVNQGNGLLPNKAEQTKTNPEPRGMPPRFGRENQPLAQAHEAAPV